MENAVSSSLEAKCAFTMRNSDSNRDFKIRKGSIMKVGFDLNLEGRVGFRGAEKRRQAF